MSSQRGRNAGVTGLFDIEGTPQFGVRVWSFELQATLARKRRRGRGAAGKLALTRGLEVGSQLLVSGDVPVTKFPMPRTFEGSAGAITLQFDTGKTATLQVEVDSCTIGYSEKTQEWWKISCTATIAAEPAFAGWPGEQPAATPTAREDAEILEQNVKSLDPDALQDTITRVWDVVALTDNDAGEVEKLTGMIASASVPMAGMKMRSISLSARDAWGGGTITEIWGRTTTGEDVVNEATNATVDPHGLGTRGSTAAINGTPLPPADFGGETPVDRGTTARELNDGAILKTTEWGLRSTEQDEEFPRTRSSSDPSLIFGENVIADVFQSADPPADPIPPAGYKLRDIGTFPLTDTRSVRVWQIARSDQKDDLELPKRRESADPDALEDSEVKAAVFLTASPDADPAVPAGLKLRNKTDLHPTPLHTLRIYEYARTSTAEDIENQGTEVTTDADGLESSGRVTKINATPDAPPGQVLRSTSVQELNDGAIRYTIRTGVEGVKAERERRASEQSIDPQSIIMGQRVGIINATEPTEPAHPDHTVLHHIEKHRQEDGRFLWIFDFRARDTRQEVEWESSWQVDVSTLDSRAELIVVQADTISAPPVAPFAGGLCTDTKVVKQITDALYVVSYTYAYETNAQKIAREAEKSSDDPNDLDDLLVTPLWETAEAPAPQPGWRYLRTELKRFPNSHTLYLHVYARRDSKDEIEFDQSILEVDESGFDSAAVVVKLQDNATPLTPALPFTDAVLVKHTIRQLTAAKWAVSYIYGYESAATRAAREASTEYIDADGWESRATTAAVDGAPPAHATLTKIGTETKQLANGHALTVDRHAVEGSKARWERENTRSDSDPNTIETRAQVASLTAEPDAPAGLKKQSVRTQEMPDGSTGYITTAGKADSKDRIESSGTSAGVDVGAVKPSERITQVTGSATPPATPASTVSGVSHVETITRPLEDNPGLFAHTFVFAARTSAQEVDDEGTVTTVEVSGLESEGAVTLDNDSSTPPATPASPIPSQELVKRVSRRRGGRWFHSFYFGWETAKAQLVRQATQTRTEASGIESSATTAAIDGAAPAVGGLTQVAVRCRTLADGSVLNEAEHGTATAAQAIVRGIAGKSIDPDGIESRATTASVAGASEGDSAGLTLASTQTQYARDGSEITISRYDGWGGSENRLAKEESRGELDPYEYEKWQEAEVITTSDLRGTLATTFAAIQNNVEFHRIRGRYLPGGKALVITEYSKEDKILMTDFEGGLVNAKSLDGAVSVVDVVDINDTWKWITTDYCTVNRVTGTLVYRRRIISATWADVLHYSAIGRRNDGLVLGIAPGYAQYLGAKVRSSEYIGGNHVRIVDYILRFDSMGFVEDSRVGIGRFATNASVGKGFALASALGWIVSAPLTTSLSFIEA